VYQSTSRKQSKCPIIRSIFSIIDGNGLGLGEGGGFEIRMLKFTIMLNRIPNAQTYDSAPLLANPCCANQFF